MDTNLLPTLSRLSDDALVSALERLAAQERESIAHLIAHLVELERRGLYLEAGFGSIYKFCTDALHLSEDQAYNRMVAAKTARKFPVILELLGNGSINLTTVRLLASHLTPENHEELLSAASHRSRREIEMLLACRFPQPPVPSLIRKLPASKSVPEPKAAAVSTAAAPGAQGALSSPPVARVPPPLPPPSRRDVVAPLALDRYKIQFTATAATCEKLERAKELLRHQIPSADLGEIFDRALTVLLEDLARKKVAATDKPRPSRGTAPGSRHIPAEVKRQVWIRDGGQCAFVGKKDRRCTERGFLEYHHVMPYAVGGEATVEGIELRCRAHNGYEAELFFGARGRSGDGVVRESRPAYWRLGRPGTRSGTGSTATFQPP